MRDIALALFKLRPGEEYGKLGDVKNEKDYENNIVWRAPTRKPTFAELEKSLDEAELDIARENKNAEIDIVASDRINARIGNVFSEEIICLLGIIAPAFPPERVTPVIKSILDISSFSEKKKKEINSQSLKEVNDYDPNADPSFPSFTGPSPLTPRPQSNG